MNRTTVMLPADLKLKVTKFAHRMGISFGEMVRRALQGSLEKSIDLKGFSKKDSIKTDNAIFSGKVPKHLSKDHDEHLYGDV